MRNKQDSQAGFTLVEILVATLVLVMGVLGAAQLVNVANGSTNDAATRNNATAIARRVVEAARGIPPRDLTATGLTAALTAAAPDLADSDPAAAGWTVERRGMVYAITASVCTLDDPSDGIGAAGSHDGSYCANPAATNPPDAQAADFMQVRVNVTYRAQRGGVVTQVTQVPVENNVAIPTVAEVRMTSPGTCVANCTITGNTTSAAFSVTTTSNPAEMTWLVRGTPMGSCPPASATCTGAANAWGFTWALGTPVKDSSQRCLAGAYTYDGIYDVGARAEDANGLSAGPAALSVTLNRCSALPPSSMVATGREATTNYVDVEWDPNTESDVMGYRVYKGTSLTSRTPVCPASVSSGQFIAPAAAGACLDSAPPAYSSSAYYYMIVALDRDTAGAVREGAQSYVNVNNGNRKPNAVTSFTATRSAAGVTLTWTLPSTQDPDSGDTIDTFRIFRRNGTATGTPALADRYSRQDKTTICNATTCSWLDTGAVGQTRTYWVSGVDLKLREATATAPRTA